MATSTPRRVALFSIKPQYAAAILAGTKKVEFRRTALAEDVSHVVVYATSPVRQVVGTFEVGGVEKAAPSALWRTYGSVGGIKREDYESYFVGTEHAYAIKVHRPHAWSRPLCLHDLDPGLRAPQSYQYLRDTALATVEPLLDGRGSSVLHRLIEALAGWVRPGPQRVLAVLTQGGRQPEPSAGPQTNPSERR